MSDQEIVDLFAGLKEVPPVAEPAKPHEVMFPFNIRLAMAGWKNLFFNPRRFEPDPAKSEEWNRGAYLANGPGHCVTCHSPRNIFGAIETGKEFTGNNGGGPGGRTPDITAHDLIRKEYTEAEPDRSADHRLRARLRHPHRPDGRGDRGLDQALDARRTSRRSRCILLRARKKSSNRLGPRTAYSRLSGEQLRGSCRWLKTLQALRARY